MKIIKINLRLFKLKFAYIINDVDDNLFEKIFGLTSVKLVSKLINITSKEDNQMLVNDIEINRDKVFKQDEYGKFAIQPAYKRGDLLDVVTQYTALGYRIDLYFHKYKLLIEVYELGHNDRSADYETKR